MRGPYSAGKRVLYEARMSLWQRAKRRVHGESAEAMAEKGRWPIEPAKHFRQQARNENINVVDGRFIDPRSAPGRLHCHHLHGVVKQISPCPKRYKPAAGEGK